LHENNKLLKQQFSLSIEAGTDEAGRGSLAGPVTAAAVILPKKINLCYLNDSKKLTETRRNSLRPQIEKQALTFAYAHVYPKEIDEINILNASIKAMHLAIEQLSKTPEFIAVDGNRFHPFPKIPHECIIKGDGKFLNIAAASVLAKTYRDDFMEALHQYYPHYCWNKNKGYPTKAHRDAIRKFGTSPHHRMTFQLLPKQL
jgi:ribonuclease HII|tara:strand:- start:116 stop:718 length:603 start_codon:yes stop_codon:yes gene_type:complete